VVYSLSPLSNSVERVHVLLPLPCCRSCRVSLKKRHRERRAESAPAILILHDAASCQQALSAAAAAAGPAAGGDGFLPLYPAGPQIEPRAELLRQLGLVSTTSTTPSVNMMDVCLPAGFAAELQRQLLLQQMEQQQQLCLAPSGYCCNQQTASPPAAAAASREAATTNPAADAAMLEGDGQAASTDEAFEAMLMQMLQEELAANAAGERTGRGLSRTISSASSCGSSNNDTADSTAHYAPSTELLLFPPGSPIGCCNTNSSMLAPPASLACSSVVFTSPAGAGCMPAACNAPVAAGLLAAPLGSMLAAPTAAAQQAWAARHARLSSLRDGMEAVRQELAAVSRALSAAEALNYQAQHTGCAAARLVSQLM